jgi:hypothetical protein
MPPGALTRRRTSPALGLTLCVAALVLLALASTAQALTIVSPSGDPRIARYQAWADTSAVPTPLGQVDLVLSTCPVEISDGCIYHGAPPTIFLGPTVRERPVLLHELGHAFDTQRMTPADRATFEAIFRDHRAWRSPPNSPHERFAEAYSLCARHTRLRKTYYAAYGYTTTPKRHRKVCSLIRRVGSAATTAVAAPATAPGWE